MVTLDKAYHICKEITVNHYENFPVASRLLPATVRRHIYPIYAFARHADDLADEAADREGLLAWRKMLHQSRQGESSHPIFIALADTMAKFDLPISLFDDLITAFLQDLDKNRYQNMEELFGYCRNSANPVGRIILHLYNRKSEEIFSYSDYICTALQLTNFWQDVKVDIQKDRIYIPGTYLEKYNVTEDDIVYHRFGENFQRLMKELTDFTEDLFKKGAPLLPHVPPRLRWQLRLTISGGLRVLDKIRKLEYNVLSSRPELVKGDWAQIVFKSLLTNR